MGLSIRNVSKAGDWLSLKSSCLANMRTRYNGKAWRYRLRYRHRDMETCEYPD